jgi:metal-dependent amidase/aminoacylase/carboxypeptidase family protein
LLNYQFFFSHAHDVYTAFMAKHGFEVTKKFHLDTAWQATFSHGTGGRTIGINSEVKRDIDELLAN